MEPQYHPNQTLQADLRQYIALLWQWAWLIILSTILAGGAAYIVSKSQDPVYQASTKLLINEAPSSTNNEYNAILLSERLARTYSQLMTEEPILEEVIDRLDLDLGDTSRDILAELTGATEVQLVRDTQLIELSVEDTDPERAALIANTIVDVFIKQNQALQSSRFVESKSSLENEMARIEGQIHNTLSLIDELGDTPQDQEERDRLEGNLSQYRQTHAGLLQSYEQIRVSEALTTSNVIQVKPATPPEDSIRPRVLMNTALAAVVGAMLAVGAIFLVEALDDTIKNPDDVSHHLGLPILGTIIKHETSNGNPVTVEEPRSPTSEAYRTLRTNIQYASVDHPIRSLLITSPSAQEGKSTIVSNLGVVLAQGGKRSILIDADMRRPTIHKKFKLPNQVGLSTLFVSHSLFEDDDNHFDSTIQETTTEGLSVLVSGKIPPNPSELLASERMSNIIKRLQQDADIVIIDTPPVTAVTDSSVLAGRADGVLLIIQPGVTKLESARHAVEQLKRVGANLVGVVLNNVAPNSSRYGYYYRYDTKYYAEEDEDKLRSRKIRKGLQWGAMGILAALIILPGGWYALGYGGGMPAWLGGSGSPTQSPTNMPVAALTTEVPAAEEILATPVPTIEQQEMEPAKTDQADESQKPTQSPTITPTSPPPTPGPGFGTPFGATGDYLLHQIKFGDNLPNLAQEYQTDRDVIIAANGLFPGQSLQPDQVIVIMPGRTDSYDVEQLIVFFHDQETMVSELASRYGVTISELRNYNGLGPGEFLPGGRWLILPKRNVTPTLTPTTIPTLDLSLALTAPFGPNDAYVLHRVSAGESIPVLEGLYLTSAEVLYAANYIEDILLENTVLVIIPECRDAIGIPQFTVLYVDEDVQVETLAEELGILTADLILYNDLESGDLVQAGKWIIYPTP